MVLTSPSRVATWVTKDIDRIGTPRKENKKLELALPVIIEVPEEPTSSPTHIKTNTTTTATRTTPSQADITTMSSLLRDLMITLVTTSNTNTNMIPSTSPRHTRLYALVCHDIDGIAQIVPKLAISRMKTSCMMIPSLSIIHEQPEDMNKSTLLLQLSLELGNVIQQQQHTTTPRSQALTSPLSCRYVPMTSPHKSKVPASASSDVTPNLSPDASPLLSHRSLMIM